MVWEWAGDGTGMGQEWARDGTGMEWDDIGGLMQMAYYPTDKCAISPLDLLFI